MARIRIAHTIFCAAICAGCGDTPATTSPDLSIAAARGGEPARNLFTVKMMDACDPATFAEVPGGCTRSGGVTFDMLIDQLTRLQRAPSWKFTPGDLFLFQGDSYAATNTGGEVHTFTEVEEFGGGIVPPLNALSGFTTVAPECETLTGGDFIPQGGTTAAAEATEIGDEHYQCCIHPWMQMTVHVRER